MKCVTLESMEKKFQHLSDDRQNEYLIGHPKQNGLLKYLKD